MKTLARLALGLSLALTACKHAVPLPDDVRAALRAKPGSYVVGTPVELNEPALLLNNEDFVYDAKPSPDSSAVAVSRLGMKNFQLTLWALENPPRQLGDVAVNPYEFDIDAVEYAPDGAAVAAVSRDRAVRAYDAKTAKLVGQWLTEEPLVTLAFHPSGHWLVVGSAKGLVTTLAWPSLQFVAETRVHADEVRALAFAPDGRLFTGSWDKSIVVFTSQEEQLASDSARIHFDRKGGAAQVRGTLAGKASATFAIDARLPVAVVVRPALAKTSGLDATELKDEVPLQSAFGTVNAKVAHGVSVSFKGLQLDGLDVAICEACVAEGAQAALGQGFADLVDLSYDEAAKEAVLKRKVATAAAQSSVGLTLKETQRFTFQGSVNDFSLDRAGKVLGVAFSETKSERTRDIYEREKKGIVEPDRAWDCGARVDAATGAVLEQVHGHHGVVATAAISPDGVTLATGGWDKRVLLHRSGGEPVERSFGWAVRRLRFTADGRYLVVAAWTPQNPMGDHKSNTSAAAWEVGRESPTVVAP
ncbi:MAG: hypothetical protein K1X89_13465 [Myxococcaceae bacterium]|nr:hypothetical protein [Myxococcaceae bacterium]